ncbi:hypothetical protein H4R24_000185 [Coemansia sp. RSA 988]|nr:hypothetical protein H4R24_000185 [Coemansia sp. RSA 988]
MKIPVPAFIFAICATCVHTGSAKDIEVTRSHDISLIPGLADRGPMAYETFRMPALFKRKMDKVDPANPVAAAATDPNEAAMKIKSRDLIPTDRPGIRPDLHRHRHSSHDDDDDDDDNDGNDADSKGNGRAKSSGGRKSKDDEKSDEDDSGDTDSKSSKKSKGGSKDKAKDDKNQKANDKDKSKDKDKDSISSKNDKKTHTGLDGKEVDNEKSEAIRKNNMRVKHVKARQSKWRTGKPKYNYRQALAGWKEVGPMYYYRGKYENSATPLHCTVPVIMTTFLSAVCAILAF